MFSSLKNSKSKGFTIIEVMIVLAIVAFIMLALFLAVPALNRSRNNTAIKSDAASLAAALTEYVNNNNGRLPANTGVFDNSVAKLWNPSFFTNSPTNIKYVANTVASAVTAPTGIDSVNLGAFSVCETTTNLGVAAGASARGVVIVYNIQTAGGTSPQCIQAL